MAATAERLAIAECVASWIDTAMTMGRISQAELARRTGLHKQYINKILKCNQGVIRVDSFLKLLSACGFVFIVQKKRL